ncbi:Chaperone protein YajL [Balamuthia mandrillaris]
MEQQKNVLVPVADGSEEIETVSIIDTLRRAGANVTVAAVGDALEVTCSRKVKLVADVRLKDLETAQQWDLIALPGGLDGAENLRRSEELKQLLLRQNQEGRLYAAICASPAVVLQTHGLLEGKQATCYPAERFVSSLKLKDSIEDVVVEDGNCVTSRSPGTALPFALRLVQRLYGREKAEELAKTMLVPSF